MSNIDCYKILNVSNTCNKNDIKQSYKKLILIWHPDKYTNVNEIEIAKIKFTEIKTAYNILSDDKKRKLYDSGLSFNEIEMLYEKEEAKKRCNKAREERLKKKNERLEKKLKEIQEREGKVILKRVQEIENETRKKADKESYYINNLTIKNEQSLIFMKKFINKYYNEIQKTSNENIICFYRKLITTYTKLSNLSDKDIKRLDYLKILKNILSEFNNDFDELYNLLPIFDYNSLKILLQEFIKLIEYIKTM